MRRSVATCYSHHAVKVSDSYCSTRRSASKTLIPSSTQNSVICIYKSKLLNRTKLFLITLTWNNSNETHKLTISDDDGDDPPRNRSVTSRISHEFWKIKGTKTFQSSCDSKIDIFWDLSNARFESGPEPVSNFHLLIVADSEIILHLGDVHFEEIVPSPNNGIGFAKFKLISRREQFSGKAVYTTKAQFCDSGSVHKIVVRCEREEENSKNVPVLSVCVDEKKMITVKRLMWNFRGNQTIFLDGILVDLMWDVHDWFFNPGSGCAVFMFRSRSGLDSRLWLDDHMVKQKKALDSKYEFSLLIFGSKNPD